MTPPLKRLRFATAKLRCPVGELHIQVCLHDIVVEDRVLRVRDPIVLGDWPGALVSFPGASIQVSRSGSHLSVLGERLKEGDSTGLKLGDVSVSLTHTVPARGTRPSVPSVDHRFFCAALVMVAVGSWVDAAEHWIERVPDIDGWEARSVIRDVIHAVRSTGAGEVVSSAQFAQRETTLSGATKEAVGEGPRHINDDHLTGIGYSRWYKNMIPADRLAVEANLDLEADPTDAEARRVVARAAYHAGRFELSAWHYQTILDDFPHDTSARLRLAWSARRQGHHRAELEMYQEILEIQPQHLLALGGAATALARLGDFDEAQDTMDALQILAPANPISETSGAVIEAIRGRHDWAIASLRRAIEHQEQLDPELQLELRQDIAVDPAFSVLRADWKMRTMLRRVLGAAAPRGLSAQNHRTR
jgi:Flp pilus assembly protein TadD